MMETITEIWHASVLGIEVGAMVLAFLAVLAGFLGRHIVNLVLEKLAFVSQKSKTAIDDIFIDSARAPAGWSAVFAGIYVALQILPLPREPLDIETFVRTVSKGASMLLLVWFAMRLSDRLCEHWAKLAQNTKTKLDDQAIPILRRTMKVFLVLLGGSLFLQNMGYSVGSILAGLGLGGMALALASKDTLANLFGAIVIFWDRPFEVGDWVDVDGLEGTIEEVGLRTTRIRTFANSLITLPNSKLTTTAVNNWSRMKKRRIKMTIGVTYDTGPEKMKAAVDAIRGIIKNREDIHQDFYLVNFDGFGASSLDIFIYCFTKTTVWAEFLETKEAFMLEIMTELHKLGLSFAFPTQTIHVESMPRGGKEV